MIGTKKAKTCTFKYKMNDFGALKNFAVVITMALYFKKLIGTPHMFFYKI